MNSVKQAKSPHPVPKSDDAALKKDRTSMPEVWCAPEKSICAVEMRLKQILEAFAERICCPEAHRNA